MANTTKLNIENVFTGSKIKHYKTCNSHFKNLGNKRGITIEEQTWFWYLSLCLELGAGQRLMGKTYFVAPHHFRGKCIKRDDYREFYRTLKTSSWKSGLIIAFMKIALVNFTPAVKSYMISWDMLWLHYSPTNHIFSMSVLIVQD